MTSALMERLERIVQTADTFWLDSELETISEAAALIRELVEALEDSDNSLIKEGGR